MKKILIQLDTDPKASTFDRVVAADAGVDELMSYGGISPDNVEPLVHGAIFTRGPADLKNTAFFVGGSRVADGEALLVRIQTIFFGPLRCSVMMDSSGSNTTAAAAVLAAGRHTELHGTSAMVLGGTGPVGFRAAQLLAGQGAGVRIVSRSLDRAARACDRIWECSPGVTITPIEATDSQVIAAAGGDVQVLVAAGAAGVEMMSEAVRRELSQLQVAIDLNAVPPVGLPGIEATDKAVDRNGVMCYGAIGTGGLKMKIHRLAIQRLFEANDLILDTQALYSIGHELEQST